MRDGQEFPATFNRFGQFVSQQGSTTNTNVPLSLVIPAPVITTVTVSVSKLTSGGVITQDNGTGNVSIPVTINGSGFMNWNGLTFLNKTVTLSTNTVNIQFLNSSMVVEPGITISSLAYTVVGGTKIVAYVNVSTSVVANEGFANAGGPYYLQITNPTSGTGLSGSTTFYVTVPTATITTPPDPASGRTRPSSRSSPARRDSIPTPPAAQTVISSVQVRITYQGTGTEAGFVWTGSQMTAANANNGERLDQRDFVAERDRVLVPAAQLQHDERAG